MPNFRGPFFIDIQYHSTYGPHRMQIPTRDYSGPDLIFTHGVFLGWDDTINDADAMIVALVDKILPFFTADGVFDNWTVYSQPTANDPAIPLHSNVFTSKVGTETAGGWIQAVQNTITWRSTTFGKSKLVFLDMASKGDFSKVTSPGTSGKYFDLNNEFTSVSNGWKAQDNGRPDVFIASTRTLNEKLRRSGRLT